MTKLKLKRMQAGEYLSHDNRVRIHKTVSQQSGRADEICWEVYIDGKSLHLCYETKRDAVEIAERQLGKAT